MEDMARKLTPLVVRHLRDPLSMFGAMVGTFWTLS